MGGAASHEFQVLADSGEDYIAVSDQSPYAANIEQAEALMPAGERAAPSETLRRVATPDTRTIADLVEQFDLPIEKTIKTLMVEADPEQAPSSLVALIVRGDHELNTVKAEKHPWVKAPLTLATEADIRQHVGAGPGSLGPYELKVPIIIDRAVSLMSDFAAGANQDGEHLFGLNWERDCPLPDMMDLRSVQNGDPSPDGQGTLTIRKGIEVGHVFQLGSKYAEALNATVLNEQGRQQVMTMGCYGIGVSRIVAAAIEQNHDERGIIWPEVMAPFTLIIIPLNAHKSPEVMATAESLYQQLLALGYDVALDDRDHKTSPGVKFADAELLGIPHRLVVSDRHLAEQSVEYKHRTAESSEHWPLDAVIPKLQALMKNP
jgi:prolyl-tRNA synthetase